MPCPYFYPRKRLESTEWDPAPRLPLGAAFSGDCGSPVELDADVADPTDPSNLCNSGYARGLCPRFPADAPADAVRFSLRINGGELIYVFEKDLAPLKHGRLPTAQLDGDTALLAQARAFLSTQKKD